jgi:deazaflavin-dependent oxidoreductase (nitroreductase family)
MLEHVGRTTGLPRYVVLETVGHPDRDTFVVVSGFGAQAQWYRNVQHEPHVHVSVGRLRRAPADATEMTEAETERMLAEYARDHPRAWERLRSVIEAAVDRQVDQLPMVRLRLRR